MIGSSTCDSMTQLSQEEGNLLRILVATDNHLVCVPIGLENPLR